MRPSPGLLLAAVIVAAATQTVRLAFPGRGPYAWTLLLSIAGVMGGELVAATGHLGAPAIGVMHPLADALMVAGLHVVGLLTTASADRIGH